MKLTGDTAFFLGVSAFLFAAALVAVFGVVTWIWVSKKEKKELEQREHYSIHRSRTVDSPRKVKEGVDS